MRGGAELRNISLCIFVLIIQTFNDVFLFKISFKVYKSLKIN